MIDLTTPLIRVFDAAGLRVSRASKTLNHQRSLALKGLAVDVVLDVGANEGQYCHEIRRMGYMERVVSFEPLSAPFQKLQNYASRYGNHECQKIALGNIDGTSSIYVSENLVSSSLLEVCDKSVEACPSSACLDIETIELRRLDSIRSEILRASDRVHLKLDTQGTEVDVLLGADETLAQVVSMELEMSLAPLYKNQLLLPQVWQIVQQRGFTCIWLERGFSDPRTGHMLQVDGLFLRSSLDV